MAIASINIPLDSETASLYTNASPDERRKMRLLLTLWLREFALTSRPLSEIMDAISDKAEARGLTPEILESILNAG